MWQQLFIAASNFLVFLLPNVRNRKLRFSERTFLYLVIIFSFLADVSYSTLFSSVNIFFSAVMMFRGLAIIYEMNTLQHLVAYANVDYQRRNKQLDEEFGPGILFGIFALITKIIAYFSSPTWFIVWQPLSYLLSYASFDMINV
jgi:hypothetical protein